MGQMGQMGQVGQMGQMGQVGQLFSGKDRVAPSRSPPQGERHGYAKKTRGTKTVNRMNQMNRIWGGSMSRISCWGKSNTLLYIKATLKCLSFLGTVERSD